MNIKTWIIIGILLMSMIAATGGGIYDGTQEYNAYPGQVLSLSMRYTAFDDVHNLSEIGAVLSFVPKWIPNRVGEKIIPNDKSIQTLDFDFQVPTQLQYQRCVSGVLLVNGSIPGMSASGGACDDVLINLVQEPTECEECSRCNEDKYKNRMKKYRELYKKYRRKYIMERFRR